MKFSTYSEGCELSGLVADVPDPIYRKATGLNYSSLKQALRSCLHYHHAITTHREPSDAMVRGKIVDHMLLTPDLPSFWIVRPDRLNLRTKEGMAWKASAIQSGLEPITRSTLEECRNMVNAVKGHPLWSDATRDGAAQMSGFSTLPAWYQADHVAFKGRFDYLPYDAETIVDLKTTQDARREHYERHSWELGYQIQAAWYIDLANSCIDESRFTRFAQFVVESEPPHGVMVYEFTPRAIHQGRLAARRAVQRVLDCIPSNQWPGYDTTPQYLDAPKWAVLEVE